MAPAHFGSVLERQMAIPKSTLPMKLSAMVIIKITIKSTSTSIRIASSMPARYARPKAGAAKEDYPVIIIPRELAIIVITMATNPNRPEHPTFARYAHSVMTPKIKRIMPRLVLSRRLIK